MTTPKFTPLNWREWARLLEGLGPELHDFFVDRVIVPERARHPNGYIKGEWAIRLTGRRESRTLIFSIRPRWPYLGLVQEKGPKAAPQGTRSVFDLSLGKHLKGARLLEAVALPRDRVVVLWFNGDFGKLGLVLVMIPASPEALLVHASVPGAEAQGWPILARSRTGKTDRAYFPPDGSRAPPELAVREELFAKPEIFWKHVEAALDAEAFATRVHLAEKGLRETLKQSADRIRQSETAMREAAAEPDWQARGDVLKASLGMNLAAPEAGVKIRKVIDHETGETRDLEVDPKLTLKEQVEKFYQNSRRRQRRLSEAQLRLTQFQELRERADQQLRRLPEYPDWKSLEALERAAGAGIAPTAPGDRSRAKGGAWLGKSFVSRDGLPIWVGRSRDENLELTFKHARGNDIWLHIRGRPGSHVLVPLSSGKSAPLETLLDAAVLCVYYSGGEKWGKTEVDYTFKKHVKRIRDSKEVSYTHNKTLLVEPEPARLKRLLG